MQFAKVHNGYVIRLLKGERLIEELTRFSRNNGIKSGWLSAIGQLLEADIGSYHLDKKEYAFKKFEQELELLNLNGNITLVDYKPFLHVHVVLSDNKFSCIGGHLKEATVGATCEVYLTEFNVEIKRIYDKRTGVKLWDCKT